MTTPVISIGVSRNGYVAHYYGPGDVNPGLTRSEREAIAIGQDGPNQ